ncbi:MAG: hypothetical protein GF398_12785 [Chitinivibrionales bacterium]|nr:hypothetical protein [Chitinivibrionales bacterium]
MKTARLFFIEISIALLFLVLIGRLFYIQVLNNKKYVTASQRQSRQRIVLGARRGAIMDARGRVMAKSVDKGLSLAQVHARLEAPAEAALFSITGSDGVSRKRIYPYGYPAGPILGFTGRDGNGLSGVEHAFETALQGESGWAFVHRDGLNNRYTKAGLRRHKPRNGSNVYLTIDMDIQKIVRTVLSQVVSQLGAQSAMGIVMEPRSGRILALCDVPGFNPNEPSRFSLSARKSRCISSIYEPGSTYKVITAAAALEEKLLARQDIIDGGNGEYRVYDQVIRDRRAFGELTFEQALSISSNVCFAKISSKLGNQKLYDYSREFGFGAPTGIPLSGEEAGLLAPVNKWSGRTAATVSIGQEISVTLLQMAAAFAAVANDGILIEPRLISHIQHCDGKTETFKESRLVRRVVSAETSETLRRMMQAVVDSGTGTRARMENITIAGKTGTSQKIDSTTNAYSHSRYWSSFIGFAPADDPILLCGVVVDEPAGGQSGGVAAAPAFRDIINRIIGDPKLPYAEQFICDAINKKPLPSEQKNMPALVGLDRDDARKVMLDAALPFSIVGNGATITHQTFAPGTRVRTALKVTLYAESDGKHLSTARTSFMPNCIGKDARDAVNAALLAGLRPHIKGMGLVTRQFPGVGTIINRAQPCTLYCTLREAT